MSEVFLHVFCILTVPLGQFQLPILALRGRTVQIIVISKQIRKNNRLLDVVWIVFVITELLGIVGTIVIIKDGIHLLLLLHWWLFIQAESLINLFQVIHKILVIHIHYITFIFVVILFAVKIEALIKWKLVIILILHILFFLWFSLVIELNWVALGLLLFFLPELLLFHDGSDIHKVHW